MHSVEFVDMPNIDAEIGGYLVCDMSSNLFTRKVNVSQYKLVYSCAQKIFGIAGLIIVIVRKDLIGQ